MNTVLPWLLNLIGFVFVAPLALVSLLLLVQTLCALRSLRAVATSDSDASVSSRIAVLIPAHNEAAGIAATLDSIRSQLLSTDRLIVVADNCSDETAHVACDSGAEVIERADELLRGKGYALDFGIQHLRTDPPDVVIMFDADCIVGAGSVQILCCEAQRIRRPVQALYIIRAANDSLTARLGEFAYRLRNLVRPLGMSNLGLPCQLMGSGMAFQWSLIDRVQFASGHLVEDLHIGLAYARQGLYPQFCPAAKVDSRSVVNPQAATIQRKRWEHGHLGTLVSECPGLLWLALRRLDIRLLFVALDVAVPPLALLTSLILLCGVLFAVVGWVGGPWWPTHVLTACLLAVFASIIILQKKFAVDLIRLGELALVLPGYLIRKVPMYLQFLVNRQVAWVRTKRDTE